MEQRVFEAFCARAGNLTVSQVRHLGRVLRSMDARIEAWSRIDARRESMKECVSCASSRLRRWGQTRTGLQRFRCRDCGKTFCSATGAAMDRVRLPEAFAHVVRDMFSASPSSCRKLAADLGIDKMTVWRWRHRIMKAMEGVGTTRFSGIVEADEKYFRESRKGSREWVRHAADPQRFPKPPRHRWEDHKRYNIPMMRGISPWQIAVLTVVDRAGGRRADILPDRKGPTIAGMLDAHLGADPVLCSDSGQGYSQLAQSRGIPHYELTAKAGIHVIDRVFHIQTINNLHARFEGFMNPFCGPATKYLSGYTAWFIARLRAAPDEAKDLAWKRLMAV